MSKMKATLVLAVMSLCFLSAHSQSCLANPPEASWGTSGSVKTYTLTFDAHCVTPTGMTGFTMCTRLYNGMLTGPTLRVERGKTYHVTLTNNLGPEHPNDASTPSNTIHHANSTNLHTHGAHISGMPPGDGVFPRIYPEGGSLTYEWEFPCDHFQGIHWYHPHLHGAATLQSGGGANGVLIVDDDPGDNLSELNGMPEKIIQIHHYDMPFLATLDPLDQVTSYSGSPSSFHLLNGEYKPTICIKKNQWTRLPWSHSDVKANMVLEIDATTSNCRIYLYAKDGNLVKNAPRKLNNNKLFFAMPSRVEIAIACRYTGIYELLATRYEPSHSMRRRMGGGGHGGGGHGGGHGGSSGTVIGYLNVQSSSYSYPSNVGSISPNLPTYLNDLTGMSASGSSWTTYGNSGSGCSSGKTYCIKISGMHGTWKFNSQAFTGNYRETLKEGSYNQWYSNDAVDHPIHPHINHLQVYSISSYPYGQSGFSPAWTQVGDWYDTQHWDGYSRFYADLLGGDLVVHCHILEHEDKGAMDVLRITGGCDANCGDMTGIYADSSNPCTTSGCSSCPSPSPAIISRAIASLSKGEPAWVIALSVVGGLLASLCLCAGVLYLRKHCSRGQTQMVRDVKHLSAGFETELEESTMRNSQSVAMQPVQTLASGTASEVAESGKSDASPSSGLGDDKYV